MFGPYTVNRRARKSVDRGAVSSDKPLPMMMLLAKERADTLRKELMRATWAPWRMRRWCLEHDDEFFDPSAPSLHADAGARRQETSEPPLHRKLFLGCQQRAFFRPTSTRRLSNIQPPCSNATRAESSCRHPRHYTRFPDSLMVMMMIKKK